MITFAADSASLDSLLAFRAYLIYIGSAILRVMLS